MRKELAEPVRLTGMTYRVGPKGQVVLPKAIRTSLGIEPGDEVTVEPRDGGVFVRRKPRGSALYGMLAEVETDLMAEFEAARREERRLEERKDSRWSP